MILYFRLASPSLRFLATLGMTVSYALYVGGVGGGEAATNPTYI
jgi:hypothetical protein